MLSKVKEIYMSHFCTEDQWNVKECYFEVSNALNDSSVKLCRLWMVNQTQLVTQNKALC